MMTSRFSSSSSSSCTPQPLVVVIIRVGCKMLSNGKAICSVMRDTGMLWLVDRNAGIIASCIRFLVVMSPSMMKNVMWL